MDAPLTYQQRWYLANKARAIATAKAWRHANKAKVQEIQKRFKEKHRERRNREQNARNAKNPERGRMAARKWREKNPAKRQAYLQKNKVMLSAGQRRWCLKNPDRVKLTQQRFQRRHPDLFRIKSAKRRAIKAAASVGSQAVILRWETGWRSRDSVRCYWCRGDFAPSKCHTDHVVALSRGGAHSIENLCIACEGCNLKKSGKPLAAWAASIGALPL